jgi:hypothetical protein
VYAYTDLGDQLGIHSQPTRPSFASIISLDSTGVGAFMSSVLAPLDTFATTLATISALVEKDADPNDPEQAEVLDGAAIDAARARFIHAVYSAAAAKASGADPSPSLATARSALSAAQPIVVRRHATVSTLYTQDGNGGGTIYPYGYLAQADMLCYWQRELVELEAALGQSTAMEPGCIF